MRNVMDSYEEILNSYDELVTAIKENTCDDEWLKVRNRDLIVLPCSREEFHDVSDQSVDDTISNLGLSIYVDGRCFPLRDTAEKSLKERACVSGAALRRLPPKDLSTVLNLCLQTSLESALIYISGDKVSALHSAKRKDYSILPILDCVELLNQKLHSIFDGVDGLVHFSNGYLSNWITQARWTLPAGSKLLRGYRKALEDLGLLIDPNIIPMVSFQTSNVGISSVKCSGIIKIGKWELNLGDIVNVEHRGDKDLKSVEEMYDLLYSQMEDGVDRLTSLMGIEIKHPEQCMNRIAKTLKLPVTEGREVIDLFTKAYTGGKVTAYDIYCAFSDVPTMMRINGCPARTIFTMQENVGRILLAKWSDYDKTGNVKF